MQYFSNYFVTNISK